MVPADRFSIKKVLAIVMAAIFSVLTAAYAFHLHKAQTRQVLEEAREKAEILLDLNQAVLVQFRDHVRPKTQGLTNALTPGSFSPQLLSTFHNLRQINEIYNQNNRNTFVYKVCTTNARIARDEADAYEAERIAAFNADPGMKAASGQREIDGQPYFTLMKPAGPVREACLGCHSSPENAPEGLVALYGTERGFGWPRGKILTAYSVNIPLAGPLARAEESVLKSSVYFAAMIGLCYFLLLCVTNRLFFAPLHAAKAMAQRIADDPSGHLGETLPPPRGRELTQFVSSFNRMSQALSQVQAGLESRVNERTQELQAEIRQRRSMEEALARARDRAETASAAKSAFLANMSHEIRTPLNGALGMLQVLLETRLDPEQRECALLALKSGNGLLEVLNDILDFSRADGGKLTVVKAPFSPAELLDSVSALFAESARNNGLRLLVERPPDLPPQVLGDFARLRQILFNLVGNALQYTRQGHIRVVASCPPGTGRLLFEVSDTGVGISRERLDQLFEPFSQGDDSYSRPGNRVGLGLSLVKRLVDLMDGALTVDSQPGQGTAIRIALPLETPPRTAQTHGSAPLPAPLGGMRILLAEDDPVNLLTTRKLLEKRGCVVRACTNGRQALSLLERESFNLVLLDILMPEMDGLETVAAIRDRDRFGDKALTPVIALTSLALSGDREKFLAAGMDGYIAKPVQLGELLHVIAKVLARERERPHEREKQDTVL